MRPEPAHRSTKRRWPNEARPLAIRIGSIRDELDARSDGTERGYRTVIMRDLKRYYALLAHGIYVYRATTNGVQSYAHTLYDEYAASPDTFSPFDNPLDNAATLDALERADVLVKHAGLPLDDALVAVGLVAKGETE